MRTVRCKLSVKKESVQLFPCLWQRHDWHIHICVRKGGMLRIQKWFILNCIKLHSRFIISPASDHMSQSKIMTDKVPMLGHAVIHWFLTFGESPSFSYLLTCVWTVCVSPLWGRFVHFWDGKDGVEHSHQQKAITSIHHYLEINLVQSLTAEAQHVYGSHEWNQVTWNELWIKGVINVIFFLFHNIS